MFIMILQIERLDLSYNDSLEAKGIGKVGRLVSQHQMKTIQLMSCDLDEECIDAMVDELENCAVRRHCYRVLAV